MIRSPDWTRHKHRRHLHLHLLVAASAAIVTAFPVAAQVNQGPLLRSEIPLSYDRGRNTSVLERERPEYEAQGIPLGSVTISPRLGIGIGHSDNVYAATANSVSDAYAAIDPALTATSDWDTNSLTLYGAGSLRRFFDQTSRDENGFRFGGDGRLDISSGFEISASAAIQRTYEQPGSSGFPTDARELVRYYATSAAVRAAAIGTRSRVTGMLDVRKLNFVDTPTFAGGTTDQDFRDRVDGRATLQYEYGVAPDASAYAQLSYSTIQYQKPLFGGQANRDGTAWRALAGLSFDLSALVRGRVALGFDSRRFDSPAFRDISGFSAEARVEYFITELTTMSATARRLIGESVLPGSGGFFSSSGSVRIDHELRRNLLLNAAATYERDDFVGITRRDSFWLAEAGANYFFSRTVGLGVNSSYLSRRSSGALAAGRFNEWRLSATITLQY